MSDEERASFTNLLLLCKPHHDLVDRIEPDRYPAETLEKWKAAREGDAATEVTSLSNLTEARLPEMIESAVAAPGSRTKARRVTSGPKPFRRLGAGRTIEVSSAAVNAHA
jgi:phytoene/squalene synthetase